MTAKLRIIVTHKALKWALRLPDEARIVAVTQDGEDLSADQFVVLVESGYYPHLGDGAIPPRVRAGGFLDETISRELVYVDGGG